MEMLTVLWNMYLSSSLELALNSLLDLTLNQHVFIHTAGAILPTASTCDLQLRVPATYKQYDGFKEATRNKKQKKQDIIQNEGEE